MDTPPGGDTHVTSANEMETVPDERVTDRDPQAGSAARRLADMATEDSNRDLREQVRTEIRDGTSGRTTPREDL
jgi:hypothetical protein